MKQIIKSTENLLRVRFEEECTGHDWFHLNRVRNLALHIHQRENAGNPFTIEMVALLHDYYDDKLWNESSKKREELDQFLRQDLDDHYVEQILTTIDSISYKGGHGKPLTSIEAKIVQDADRLDAIGAIGIARTFAYGGKKGQLLHDPAISVRDSMNKEEYRNGKSTSIHHFHEKLLKLSDMLHTDTAKAIAKERHQYMEEFLQQFNKEWDVLL